MREVSASDASRNFSAVLDSAERGETIVVVRGGRRVATISPASRHNGGLLRAVFDAWHHDPALDDTLADNIEAARGSVASDRDLDPWHD